MKILTWNFRGLAQPYTIRSLKAIIRKNNPNILFLSETMIVSHIASSILHQLGLSMLI
jgi:exonuclease III